MNPLKKNAFQKRRHGYKVKFGVYLPPEIENEIAKRAEEHHMGMSELVRIIILNYLKFKP